MLPLNRFLPQPDEAYEFWDWHTGIDFARSALLRERADEKTRKAVRAAVLQIMRWQMRPKFAAKFTGPARIEYLQSIFPNATFVHVIRDGRAVVHSLMRVEFWRRQGGFDAPFWNGLLDEHELSEWKSSGGDPGVLAGMQWRRVIESARLEKSLLDPARYVEVRYEEFLDDPHSFLSRLFSACGLPDAPEVHSHVDTGPALSSMNKKFETEFSSVYVKRLTASMEPEISQLSYATTSI